MRDTGGWIKNSRYHISCFHMSNTYFRFKQFIIHQDRTAMKVTTDACLFGAWLAGKAKSQRINQRLQVLDIGTGTGLLALMLAQKIKNADIHAIEVDDDSFVQAKENIAASPWSGRVTILHDDARTLRSSTKYDIIISNPPFYEKELKGSDAKKNIAHHDEGLLFPDLMGVIKNNLNPGGHFYLLLPYKRYDEIRKLLFDQEFDITGLVLVRQTMRHDYFRFMLEGKSKTGTAVETNLEEIAIKDENENYTPGFVNLLEDYYLKL